MINVICRKVIKIGSDLKGILRDAKITFHLNPSSPNEEPIEVENFLYH